MTVNRDDYQAAFSKRLKQTIQAKDMKYLEVANKADVGLNAVSKWANGIAMPSVFTFAKLCVAMKLDARTICRSIWLTAKSITSTWTARSSTGNSGENMKKVGSG